MRRSVLAVTGAVMLSMVPAIPPALAAPFSFNSAVITSDSGSLLTEVSSECRGNRAARCRSWHRQRGNYSDNYFPYDYYHHNNYYRSKYHRNHHRRHHGGPCIRIEGFSICF